MKHKKNSYVGEVKSIIEDENGVLIRVTIIEPKKSEKKKKRKVLKRLIRIFNK